MAIQCLAGRRILVVEDDFFAADDLVNSLTEAGATVLGPVATVSQGLALIACSDRLDGAVLDINLGGEMSFILADALLARGVAVVFASGYDRETIPERFVDVPLCHKPVDTEQCAEALFK